MDKKWNLMHPGQKKEQAWIFSMVTRLLMIKQWDKGAAKCLSDFPQPLWSSPAPAFELLNTVYDSSTASEPTIKHSVPWFND